MYHLITRDDRLETVAKDIVGHFLGRGFQGKAMVISIDKATALRMHDKVRKHWMAELQRVQAELGKKSISDDQREELTRRRDVLKTTDMAVIVSPGQNEIEQMRQLGLDILPHRQRMNSEALDEKFKDPKDPLGLVFVCAMWLTGFDAPSCSTVYLDKPMRNHTLMQTIARANRVFPGKHSGMIVDYANVFASLEKALAIYGTGSGGENPVRSKDELLRELEKAVTEAAEFCRTKGVYLDAILAAEGMDRLSLLGDAVNQLITPDPLRKEYLAHEKLTRVLLKAVKPDPAVIPYLGHCATLAAIADAIQARLGSGDGHDISSVLSRINDLLDASIATDGFRITKSEGHSALLDLSKIDFAALAKRFAKSPRKNIEIEQLKAAVRATLERMIRLNPTRVDFQKKFELLISEYNAGSRNIDELFEELVRFSRSLTEEQERHVRENLSEEELTVFDILTRPDPALKPAERDQVKKVVRQLYTRLQGLLVIDWRKRSSTRASVQEAISSILDEGLPDAYSRQIYQKKCSLVFEHIYEAKTA